MARARYCSIRTRKNLPSHSQTVRYTPVPMAIDADASGSTKWCAVIGLCVKTISVCNNLGYCMYGSNSSSCISCIHVHVRMLRCNSDGHIELGDGPLNSVDGPQVVFACPLNPHFAHSATHCVGWVTGINIRPLVPMP